MQETLTLRQREIYKWIASEIETGIPPTVREIGDHFRISSPNGVMCHLRALENKGFITRYGNLSRGIQLTRKRRAVDCLRDAKAATIDMNLRRGIDKLIKQYC